MVDPTGMYECDNGHSCRVAREGINQIKSARDHYASVAGSTKNLEIAEKANSAVRAIDKVLGTLGTEGDGGVNIQVADLSSFNDGDGAKGLYKNNTIYLDTNAINDNNGSIGGTLAHETVHKRLEGEKFNIFSKEVRPFYMQFIIERSPVIGIIGLDVKADDYVYKRLYGYCSVRGTKWCNEPRKRAIAAERWKPF